MSENYEKCPITQSNVLRSLVLCVHQLKTERFSIYKLDINVVSAPL